VWVTVCVGVSGMMLVVMCVCADGVGALFGPFPVPIFFARLSPDTTAGPLPTLDRPCPRVTPPEWTGEESRGAFSRGGGCCVWCGVG
jgi:hypothetical protein